VGAQHAAEQPSGNDIHQPEHIVPGDKDGGSDHIVHGPEDVSLFDFDDVADNGDEDDTIVRDHEADYLPG
jgi:hypothetical protein